MSYFEDAYLPRASYNSTDVLTMKLKTGYSYDLYECRGCGRQWKSSAKQIGHTLETCARRQYEDYKKVRGY